MQAIKPLDIAILLSYPLCGPSKLAGAYLIIFARRRFGAAGGQMLRQAWPWALIVLGGVFLYLQGYRHGGGSGPVIATALVIVAIGGGLILLERKGRWK
jgi:hypothetical protein